MNYSSLPFPHFQIPLRLPGRERHSLSVGPARLSPHHYGGGGGAVPRKVTAAPNRPGEFDRHLMAYLPALRSAAWKQTRSEEGCEEVVYGSADEQEDIIFANEVVQAAQHLRRDGRIVLRMALGDGHPEIVKRCAQDQPPAWRPRTCQAPQAAGPRGCRRRGVTQNGPLRQGAIEMNEDQIRIQAQHDAYSRTLENNRVRLAYRKATSGSAPKSSSASCC